MPSTQEHEQPRKGRSPAGTISLASVAARANVSEATVSRVLNRKYGVSAATRDAVEEAMRALGYQRNVAGELVLAIIPDLVNPLFARLSDAVEAELSPHGLRLLLCPVRSGSVKEREYINSLLDSGIAAVVFLSATNTLHNTDSTAREMLVARGIPFVSINGGFEDIAAPVFSTDDWRAAEMAVEHLYALGHRRIGMCAGPVGNTPADRRVEGFVRAMDALALPEPEDFIARQHYSVDGGRNATDELLQKGVTAVVACSDDMALGAYRAAERRGLRVPEDISVVGYDDSYLLDFTAPPLTTVRQPVERLAEHTIRSIVALIGHRTVAEDEVFFEPELRIRASTAPPPAASPSVAAGS